MKSCAPVVVIYAIVLVTGKASLASSTEIIQTGNVSLLEQICNLYNVSHTNCTCDHLPEFCEQSPFKDVDSDVTESYVRSIVCTIVYATVSVVSATFGLVGNIMVLFVAGIYNDILVGGWGLAPFQL